jgi:hypothetical protein
LSDRDKLVSNYKTKIDRMFLVCERMETHMDDIDDIKGRFKYWALIVIMLLQPNVSVDKITGIITKTSTAVTKGVTNGLT